MVKFRMTSELSSPDALQIASPSSDSRSFNAKLVFARGTHVVADQMISYRQVFRIDLSEIGLDLRLRKGRDQSSPPWGNCSRHHNPIAMGSHSPPRNAKRVRTA